MSHLRYVVIGLTLILCAPFVAHAELININTADAAALDTLPGIGPSKAAAIIDYRTQQGPFAVIADIQNVSGIGPATFANIQSLITVSGSTQSTTGNTTAAVTTTSSTHTASPVTVSETATAPPVTPQARIVAGTDRTSIVGADALYTAEVYDAGGIRRTDAAVTWSFGDGTSGTGASVAHAYFAQGDYAVVAEAVLKNGEHASTSFVVSAIPVMVRIDAVSSAGITIHNSDTHTLDLSGWQLVSGGQLFTIPANTRMLGDKTITFASQVTGLLPAASAELRFPSGVRAVSGPIAPVSTQTMKPSPAAPALSKVQTVETIPSAVTSTSHGTEAVVAPAAKASLAAAGAAVETASTTPSAPGTQKSFLTSPWSWGLTSVLLMSAGAFIFL
ncbi:MAG TPA: helix-hairpin-helix domain-containing protein [Candidatus Paceibacterota bacterium]|nr:helix-hairpin-helix domain-containing protein [Candidatus Paceibacterota bacterium]